LFLFTALLWSYFRYMEHMEQLGLSRAHQELRFETFTSLHLPCGPQDFACDPQGQIWKLQTFLSRFELFIANFLEVLGFSRLALTQEKRTWPLLGVSLHGFREISRQEDHLHSFTLFSCCLLLCVSSKLYLRVREQIVCHGWLIMIDYNWYLVVIFILDWFYSHIFLLKLVYYLVSPWIRPNPVWHELSNDLQLIRNCLGWFGIRKYPRGTFRVWSRG
jgi:hypothetical protein